MLGATARVRRYFFKTAETSIAILTLSPTNRLPLPRAWLNFISKSLRFRNPWTSAPARSLPHGSVSVPCRDKVERDLARNAVHGEIGRDPRGGSSIGSTRVDS